MIYAVIIYFSVLFLLAVKNHKWVVFKYLVGVYLLSLFTSLYLINSNVFVEEFSVTASIVFCVGITLLFMPFYRYAPRIEFASENTHFVSLFKRIGYIIGISYVVFMILGIPAVTKAFLFGALDIRNGESADFISELPRISRYGCYILYNFNGISYMLIVMFFYSFIYLEKDKALSVLLLLASLAAPYTGIMVGGRTYLIYWLLFFSMCLLLFFPCLNKRKKKQLFIPVSAILAILVVYFVVTTNNRFEYSELSATESVEQYTGKSFVNFCIYFDNLNYPDVTLRRVLPLTTSLFEGEFDLIKYRNRIEGATGYDIGTFYTLLGDLYVDLGLVGMFVYCILYFIIAKGIFNKRKVFHIENMIVMCILVQIPLHGLFYYSYWHTRASLSIIVSLIIAFLLKNARLKKV